jgi:GalNAc-alpha-(1->4)-GalNAc-alpha-(1->3)-diNAcBac-PP-undecaprenol alpha-1,4-N-acetyl-D-galactosaminyltransferase
MNKMKFTLIFKELRNETFGKDVFLVPYYIGKIKGYDVDIVYPQTIENKNLERFCRGVNLIPLKSKHIFFSEVLYIIRNAKKIDILMRFHYTKYTKAIVCLYKILNRKGFVYIKGDVDIRELKRKAETYNDKKVDGFKSKLGLWITRLFVKNVNLYSCETEEEVRIMKNSDLARYKFQHIAWLPNAFDEEKLDEMDMHINNFTQKSNTIITVGRLGSYQKNTEMLLKSLESVNLKGWTVLCIGSIEDSFKPVIEDFYKNNEAKFDSVVFTNPIYDKRDLWKKYNDAKVFVLTSRYESWGLVYNEAFRFQDFIITTDVGGAKTFIGNNQYGQFIEQESHSQLSRVLQNIIDGKKDIDVFLSTDTSVKSWYNVIYQLKDLFPNSNNI